MVSTSSVAGLKCLQWTFRAIQFGCAVIVLGIYSYYLATLLRNSKEVPMSIRAVEGISGAAVIYTLLGVLLVCACAGHPAPSFVSLIFDLAFCGAFIYVAVANKAGASSCSGDAVNTVFGTGAGDSSAGDGMPTFGMACRMEMACLIVASIASFFFLASIPLEIKINRSSYRLSRPIRDADGEYITKSEHYGVPQRRHKRAFFGLGGAAAAAGAAPYVADPDHLPPHQQVRDIQSHRVAMSPGPQPAPMSTWGEISSLHDSDRLYFNDGASRDEHGPPMQPSPPVRFHSTTAPRPAAGVYNEGYVPSDDGESDFNDVDLERGVHHDPGLGSSRPGMGQRQETPVETGTGHRDTKAARFDRLEAS